MTDHFKPALRYCSVLIPTLNLSPTFISKISLEDTSRIKRAAIEGNCGKSKHLTVMEVIITLKEGDRKRFTIALLSWYENSGSRVQHFSLRYCKVQCERFHLLS